MLNLSLSFYALLAGILLVLSVHDVSALPLASRRATGIVKLPLKRLEQRGGLHPQVLLQQHINRSVRRLARMTGREVPSDAQLRSTMEKRVASLSDDPIYKRFNKWTPPTTEKRFNRNGASRINAVAPQSFRGHHHGQGAAAAADAASTSSSNSTASTTDSTASTANSTGSTTDPSTAPDSVTVANAPSAADSLGLDIESTDVGYLATVQMGTPPADFLLLMDSGSADTWVGSEQCVSEDGGDCGAHNFLGSTASSTFTDTGKPFSVTYGTGAVAGNIITDNLAIAGLALDAHTFGVATEESDEFSGASTPFDGLMGLAQSSLSEQATPTPPESLAAAGLIPAAVVSYKIPRLADNLNDGEISFGGLDASKFDASTLVTVPNVNAQGFWEAAVDGASVDGTDLGLSGRTAILDTGTTLMVVPLTDATAIHAAINGSTTDGQGGFTVPCTTTASVALTFGGQEFTIDSRDIAFTPVDATDPTGDCVSGIAAGNIGADTEWLVGDTFLKNAYFSHSVDDNTLSLAKLV